MSKITSALISLTFDRHYACIYVSFRHWLQVTSMCDKGYTRHIATIWFKLSIISVLCHVMLLYMLLIMDSLLMTSWTNMKH